MTRPKQQHLNEVFMKRRLCPESGKATGLWEVPKTRRRCLVCNRLVRFEELMGQIFVCRHYVYPNDQVHGRWAP